MFLKKDNPEKQADLKVLIIDDDEDDFFITSQYLKGIDDMNIVCDWCYNIAEARKKLYANEYDFYFLDYRLGAKTGLELLEEALKNGSHKPIVILTGMGTPDIDKKAVELGAYDYLVKNELNSEKLERCLRYSLERYKHFKQLNDNEKKYRLIFENAQNFIFTCNQNFHFNECNSSCEYFTGYTAQELKGTSLFSLLIDEDKTKLLALVSDKKNNCQLNLKFVTKGGEIKTGNVSLSYFEDEDMEPHWEGIIFDETLRAQMEQTKLHFEKLEATYRLVRTLAHDIRTPLTNILLALEALQDKDFKEDKISYSDIIRRGSKRIDDIISNLLHSSKVLELNPEPVDLNELIDEVLSMAQDRIQLKNVQTKISKLNFPVVKVLDKENFKIAILNLVVNAIEAMNKPENILSLSLLNEDNRIVIQIQDNGIGIKDDELKKLFEPYFTTKKNGMGLGLVSALNIIKSHKANMEVKSEFGKGSVFKVVFWE